ncbi:MAG: superinfection immunity protein [Gammaproteobacteria bacterium]|nr:superinfection immunity protein [Gammaproteobacteria bacterium]
MEWLWLLLIPVTCFYFAPTIIAVSYEGVNKFSFGVFGMNFVLCWSVIGWLFLLIFVWFMCMVEKEIATIAKQPSPT